MLKNTRSSEALFACYLANLNATTDSFRRSKFREAIITDQMKVDFLIKKVGSENSWSEDQLKLVLTILIKNQIFSVRDLRSLSKEKWARIELVPSVKELLREAISRGSYSRGNSLKKRFARKLSESGKGSVTFKENLNFSLPPQPPPQRQPPPPPSASEVNEKTPSTSEVSEKPLSTSEVSEKPPSTSEVSEKPPSTSEVSEKSPTRFLPPPNRKVDGDKLKVRASDGKLYKVDRWCPRDKADLNVRGFVVGSKLFCTKHSSSFDMEEGGIPTDDPEGATINALPIDSNEW